MQPLRTESEIYSTKIFETIAFEEKEVERARRSLNQCTSFEVRDLFSYIDYDGNGLISASELHTYLKSPYITLSQVDAIIGEYDSDCDQRLNIQEFEVLCLSAEDKYLRQDVLNRPHKYYPPYIRPSLAVITKFDQLVRAEINYSERVSQAMRTFTIRQDISTSELYFFIGMSHTKPVTNKKLQRFLNRNYYYPSAYDLDAIMRRLDHDGDGKLDKSEFRDAVTALPSAPARASSHSPVREAYYPIEKRGAQLSSKDFSSHYLDMPLQQKADEPYESEKTKDVFENLEKYRSGGDQVPTPKFDSNTQPERPSEPIRGSDIVAIENANSLEQTPPGQPIMANGDEEVPEEEEQPDLSAEKLDDPSKEEVKGQHETPKVRKKIDLDDEPVKEQMQDEILQTPVK